jgi:hypothetical protein
MSVENLHWFRALNEADRPFSAPTGSWLPKKSLK